MTEKHTKEYKFLCPTCQKHTILASAFKVNKTFCMTCGTPMVLENIDKPFETESPQAVPETPLEEISASSPEKETVEFVESTQEPKPIEKTPWEIDVQESQVFYERGLDVMCFRNAVGKKLYLRPTKQDSENNIVMEPLTVAELNELDIEESQSSYNAEMEIET